MTSHYRLYIYHLKETFSSRIYQVAFYSGFTFPNINGTVVYGEGAFRDNKTFFLNSRVSLRPDILDAFPGTR